MKEKVCVTGASGGLGQALLEELIPGYDVTALFRAKTDLTVRWEQRGCRVVVGGLEDDDALAKLVCNTKVVFHCAALVGKATYASAHAINVEGTRRLARIAAHSGCLRFIHTSSVAVYSRAVVKADYTEDVMLNVSDEMAVYARTKLEAEKALVDVAAESGMEYAILRPTCIYGPNTKSYTEIPIALIKSGLPVVLGDGSGLLDAVYVSDVARALRLTAESREAAGQVFNIGNDLVTLDRFYGSYASMLDRPVRHIPIAPLRAMTRWIELLPERRRAALRELRNSIRFLVASAENSRSFPSTKAKHLLGYSPQVNLSMGMLQTELWAKSQGIAPRRSHQMKGYGILPFRPLTMVRAENEDDIVRIVESAAKHGLRAKTIGSLHSQCPIPQTDGVCIVLSQGQGLIRVDGDLVTIPAGMTLRNLNEALAEVNLALPTLGSIAAQTVAGAICTGTHGGSFHHGSLSDCVESLRIVKADGTVVDVNRSNSEFPAVCLSLGALGFISTVTLRCVSSFDLESRSSVEPVTSVIEQFDQISRQNRYTDMLYHPVADQAEILFINTPAGPVPRQTTVQAPRSSAATCNSKKSHNHNIKIAAIQAIASAVRHNVAIQKSLTNRLIGRSYRPHTGRSDVVLAFSDLGSNGRSPNIVGDMELAVPYERAAEAIHTIRHHFQKTKRYPLLPIHIRCSRASDLWLSPAYRQNVCWLEFCSYPRSDSLFREVHELLAPFDYRFHWGKESVAGRDYIQPKYEKWDDFAKLRKEWDPKGMFLNSYLESFFGS